MVLMLLFTFKIFGICLSVFSWIILSLAGFSLIWQYKDGDRRCLKLLLPILLVSWSMVTYNTWYNDFFLLQEVSVFTSLNSWILTLIIPLFYFYCRYLIDGYFPDKLQWGLHLFFPVLLLCIYIMSGNSTHISDKMIDDWLGFLSSFSICLGLFRVGCCLLSIIQLTIYFFYLQRIDKKQMRFLVIQKKVYLVWGIGGVIILSLQNYWAVFSLLGNLLIVMLGGFVFSRSHIYKNIKLRLKSYLSHEHMSPSLAAPDGSEGKEDETDNEKQVIELFRLPDEAKTKVHEVLDSREFLFNEHASIEILAKYTFVNVTYLSLYFNKELGMGFREYLKIHRLNAAEEFLVETDMQIADITIQIGFKNTTTFCQAFHERYGMPPMQWRKEKKQSLC